MTDISKAQAAKRDAHLNSLIRSDEYGITTMREFVLRTLNDGGVLETAQIPDETARRKAEKEYEYLRREAPLGNPNHPETIRYYASKAAVQKPPTKIEYRLKREHPQYGASWSVLSKTAYEFGLSLVQQ